MSEEIEKNLFQFETVEGEEREKHKPHFSVKMNGNYVGSGWMADGKYGKYVSLAINHDVPQGSKVYLYPSKANPAILG